MNYNYHTHTFRCKHASGTPEEYVQRAIENGIKYMGFSDHVPLRFEGGKESGFRVPFDSGEEYCRELKALAEKYKDQIEIKVGFEAEYYPEYFPQLVETVKKWGAEYLILGQHYNAPENLKTPLNTAKSDDREKLKAFVSVLCEAIKTGKFTYVAHPDIINYIGDKEIYLEEMRELCICAKEHNIPLEINFLGIRDHRFYPNEWLWPLVGEIGTPVTFGFDAHDIPAAYDAESLECAKEMVKKYNLNYIGKPTLRLL